MAGLIQFNESVQRVSLNQNSDSKWALSGLFKIAVVRWSRLNILGKNNCL